MSFEEFKKNCGYEFCNNCDVYKYCQDYFEHNVLYAKEFGSRKHFDGINKLMRKEKLEKLLS